MAAQFYFYINSCECHWMRSAGYSVWNNKYRHRIVTINFELHCMAYFWKIGILHHIPHKHLELVWRGGRFTIRARGLYGDDYILQVELMTDMDYLNCNDKIARLIKTPHGSGDDNKHVSLVIKAQKPFIGWREFILWSYCQYTLPCKHQNISL